MMGQRAMFQIMRVVSPRPTASPIALATGPLTASINAPVARQIRPINVTSSMTGRSFQTGRPSSTSYMRFIARPKAPT